MLSPCCTRNRTSKFLVLENAPVWRSSCKCRDWTINVKSVDHIDEKPFTTVLMVFVDEDKQIWLLSGFPIEFESFFAFTVGMT